MMTRLELERQQVPFIVVSIHSRKNKLTVTKIDEDPLDVGVKCAYFKEGGWLMISDLCKNFDLLSEDNETR